MVTPERLAELIEGESVMEATAIEEREDPCPDCGESVLEVGYMASVSTFVRGAKCQECDWSERRE